MITEERKSFGALNMPEAQGQQLPFVSHTLKKEEFLGLAWNFVYYLLMVCGVVRMCMCVCDVYVCMCVVWYVACVWCSVCGVYGVVCGVCVWCVRYVCACVV